MDNEDGDNEIERELREKLAESRRQILMEREYFELYLEERQLSLVLSSTDIQRILDITTEEQQIHIESEIFEILFIFHLLKKTY